MGYNRDKLLLFFPQKAETTDELATKIERNQRSINRVAFIQTLSKKFEKRVEKPTSRSERYQKVGLQDFKAQHFSIYPTQ